MMDFAYAIYCVGAGAVFMHMKDGLDRDLDHWFNLWLALFAALVWPLMIVFVYAVMGVRKIYEPKNNKGSDT